MIGVPLPVERIVVGDTVLFDPAQTKGFTTRASDVQELTTPAQVIEGLAREL